MEPATIQAVGTPPTGPSVQVISRWSASIEMGLGAKTKQITVQGNGEPIVLIVPHKGPRRSACGQVYRRPAI